MQEVLTEADMVKHQKLPEEHLTWTSRASNHDLLRRPAALAINTRGDVLVAEAENHVILFYTRHVPVKLRVAAGQWGKPGSVANGEGEKVKLRHPTALAMLVLEPRKKEICYFVDAGNKAIRLLRNAHSFDATQTVETVRLQATEPLEPLGIALISQSLLAISEDRQRRVRIAHLDDTHSAGLLLSTLTWDGLNAPLGLAALNGSLFVADGVQVLGVGIGSSGGAGGRVRRAEATAMRRNASSRVGPTAAFTDARAVAVCEDANGAALLAVADLGKHHVRLLGLRGLAVVSSRVLGTGVPGHVNGAIDSASFNEPLALAFDNGILHVACYGGQQHGTVSTVTPTAFAVRTLSALSKAYDAIGFVTSNATAEQRARRHPPVREAVRDLAACGELLEAASKARNEALGGGRGAEGPEGTWPLYQAEAIKKTAASVGSVLDAMEVQGLGLAGVTLAAFVNESGMESSFGQADMRTQYRHPDQQHYCQRKPAALMRTINRCCQTPHSEHTGRSVHYQAPQQSSLSAMAVARVVRRAWRALQGRAQPLDPAGKVQLQREMERARQLQHVAAVQRTNNVRASNYAARCGYAPTVLQPNEVQVERAEAASLVISFDQALARVRDGTIAARARAPQQTLDTSFTRDKFVFVPGDIVFLEAGVVEVEDNLDGFVDATEPWWALQVTQPFERLRMRSGCVLRGFWLNRVARCSAGRWVLLAGAEVRQRYGTVLKAAGRQPIVISSSELETGWSSADQLMYTLPPELILQLDRLAAEAAREPAEGEGSDGGTTSEVEEGGEEGEAGGGDEAEGGEDAAQPAVRDRDAGRARRDAARAAQLTEAQGRRDARSAAQRAEVEARRVALPEQLQGGAAGVDLAPAARPRREARPFHRLIERD